MTLDEAIKHCLEVAEQNETQADKWQEEGGEEWGKTTACRECAAEHRQLAEWLTELRELRETHNAEVSIGGFFEDTNKILVDRIKELEEENEEAKRLLKMAVEDFSNMYDHIFDYDRMCDTCPLYGERDNCLIWRYADEALALIEEDGDTNG